MSAQLCYHVTQYRCTVIEASVNENLRIERGIFGMMITMPVIGKIRLVYVR